MGRRVDSGGRRGGPSSWSEGCKSGSDRDLGVGSGKKKGGCCGSIYIDVASSIGWLADWLTGWLAGSLPLSEPDRLSLLFQPSRVQEMGADTDRCSLQCRLRPALESGHTLGSGHAVESGHAVIRAADRCAGQPVDLCAPSYHSVGRACFCPSPVRKMTCFFLLPRGGGEDIRRQKSVHRIGCPPPPPLSLSLSLSSTWYPLGPHSLAERTGPTHLWPSGGRRGESCARPYLCVRRLVGRQAGWLAGEVSVQSLISRSLAVPLRASDPSVFLPSFLPPFLPSILSLPPHGSDDAAVRG